jgi:hypothetical protein
VRTAGEPDRIYVVRSDGSEVSWSLPTYGDALPHDLVHLVVESAFGLARGFWGRVDAGADPRVINAEANRRGGARKYAAFGGDRSELDLAEALAACRWQEATALDELRAHCAKLGVDPPSDLGPKRVREVGGALKHLTERWRSLRPKGALHLVLRTDDPRAGFEAVAGSTSEVLQRFPAPPSTRSTD